MRQKQNNVEDIDRVWGADYNMYETNIRIFIENANLIRWMIEMELEYFLQIENKYGLIQEEIDGFAYWTYFRRDLAVDIMRKVDSGGETYVYPVRTKLQQTMARLGTIKYALLFGGLRKQKRDMLILNAERRKWVDGCYECIYTDRIAMEYPNSIVLERPYFQKHFRPVKTGRLVYTDPIEIKTMVYWYSQQLLHGRHVAGIREAIRNKIQKPIEEICKAYQVEYEINQILDKMVCGYYVYKVKRKEYSRVLDKVDPRIILEVVGYNMDCMIVNELALIRHIPTVELQHGATGKTHIAYNYCQGERVRQFPQYFFSFSKFWIDSADYPLTRDRLKEIGFPFLEEKARDIKRRVGKRTPHQIIFISQPKIGEQLSELAVGLNEMIDTDQYRIVFKLHPGEYERWRERYVKLAASGIEVIDNNYVDLYELFAASMCQIGGYSSTALYEGLEFNLKTYILRESAYPELAFLCEKGMANFFDSVEDLYHLIITDSAGTKAEACFWKENAMENMKRKINDIMNER